MAFSQQQRPEVIARQLRGKGSASLEFTQPIPYRQLTQAKLQRNLPEEPESDSKSVIVPSLSMGESSRASSINNLECRSEVDDSIPPWVLHEDEHASVFKRCRSPLSMEDSNFHRTPMDLGTLPDRQACNVQPMSNMSEAWQTPINNERKASLEAQSQRLICLGEPLSTSLALVDSKVLVPQQILDSELSDSDSESEEESSNDGIENGEWSGANDNIEDTLYQAVYPDVELAAHLVSTMYPALVISYRKKITSKVSSWQERNIVTCNPNSGVASNTTEAASHGASNAENGSSPKHDRKYSSPDDNNGDDEDEEAEESRRKRPKEQPDTETGIPKPRFACPFYKKDPMKYSAAESGRNSCAGRGWTSISQMKEHLQRAHRPVQCGRCYRIFAHKNGGRSNAVSDRERHILQEDRCLKRPGSLKEGINDTEWARISEKKKNRKGKGKRKVTTSEQAQSQFEQWYEIWVILCPGLPRPSTPWSTPAHPYGLPHNEHFLSVSKQVNEHKLMAIKNAVLSGSDDEVLSLLLECDQQKYSVYRSTFMAISNAGTDSFSDIDENFITSSNDTTSCQRVPREPYADSPEPSSRSVSNSQLPNTDFATQTKHLLPIAPTNTSDSMIDGRKLNLSGNPQILPSNDNYALDNIQSQPMQRSPRTATVPAFESMHVSNHINRLARPRTGMDGNLQNIAQQNAYVTGSQASYSYPPPTYTPDNQAAYLNTGAAEPRGSMWSPLVEDYDMQVTGEFDLASFEPDISSLQDHQWSGQYQTPTSRHNQRPS